MLRLRSNDFTWDKATGLGIADASDIFGQSAVPMEFTVTSTRTGITKTFKAHKTRKDSENEVAAFVFRSGGHRPVTVEVVND